MKSLRIVVTLFLAMAVVAFTLSSAGLTDANATDSGPTPNTDSEGPATYGTLFYIGLGAVAVIGTFAIWQNIKDSNAKKAALEAETAEDKEIEDFDEYFKTKKEVEAGEDSSVIKEKAVESTSLASEENEK